VVDIAIPSIKGDYDLGFTSYLFPDPDVPYSVGQVLDLFGTPQHYNRSPSPEQADVDAFRRDWAAVGADLRAVLDRFALKLR
jgi:hypothetical protein